MQATPISSTKRRTNIMNIGRLTKTFFARIQIAVERRKISRCPAVRLAANRRPRAIGWANNLIVSIQTISGIKRLGVP